jgi:hypothetical protein
MRWITHVPHWKSPLKRYPVIFACIIFKLQFTFILKYFTGRHFVSGFKAEQLNKDTNVTVCLRLHEGDKSLFIILDIKIPKWYNKIY